MKPNALDCFNVSIEDIAVVNHIARKFGKFDELSHDLLKPSKLVLTINLLADLLIRQTLFCQILEKSQFTKLSHYTLDAITYKQQSTCSYNLLL